MPPPFSNLHEVCLCLCIRLLAPLLLLLQLLLQLRGQRVTHGCHLSLQAPARPLYLSILVDQAQVFSFQLPQLRPRRVLLQLSLAVEVVDPAPHIRQLRLQPGHKRRQLLVVRTPRVGPKLQQQLKVEQPAGQGQPEKCQVSAQGSVMRSASEECVKGAALQPSCETDGPSSTSQTCRAQASTHSHIHICAQRHM